MRREIGCILALVLLSLSVLSCATNSQKQGIKCPKCGYYFSTKEGADFLKSGQGQY
jgi:hypothetical protein